MKYYENYNLSLFCTVEILLLCINYISPHCMLWQDTSHGNRNNNTYWANRNSSSAKASSGHMPWNAASADTNLSQVMTEDFRKIIIYTMLFIQHCFYSTIELKSDWFIFLGSDAADLVTKEHLACDRSLGWHSALFKTWHMLKQTPKYTVAKQRTKLVIHVPLLSTATKKLINMLQGEKFPSYTGP